MSKSKAETVTRSERIFIRISIMQTILAVIALCTGLIALYATMTESQAIRKQTAASVWPHAQMGMQNFDPETGKYVLKVVMSNAGVGPAKINGFRFTFNGETMKSWNDFLEKVDPDHKPKFVYSSVRARVMTANEKAVLLTINDEDVVKRLFQNMATAKFEFEYCYCSIFDDCWVAGMNDKTITKHTQVEVCPNWGDESFQN